MTNGAIVRAFWLGMCEFRQQSAYPTGTWRQRNAYESGRAFMHKLTFYNYA